MERRVYLSTAGTVGLFGLAGCSGDTVPGTDDQGGCEDHGDVEAIIEAGAGTQDDPYRIRTLEQLQGMRRDLKAHYRVVADIDASPTAEWNGGAGFEPIGEFVPESQREDDTSYAFVGGFDGGGHTIDGLTIDRPDEGRGGIGLFGRARDVEFARVQLSNVSVTGNIAGGLVGDTSGTVRDITVSGEVTGTLPVGGVVGRINGDVAGIRVSGQVAGEETVGGVVGDAGPGTIERARSDATVTGGDKIGGLAGRASDRIRTCRVSGEISGESGVGGIVGESGATFEQCGATAPVSADTVLGGLAGNVFDGDITACYTRGGVDGGSAAGGFVGQFDGGTIDSSYTSGSLSADRPSGPFVGVMKAGQLKNCYGGVTESDMDFLKSREDIDTEPFLLLETMRGDSATKVMSGFDFEQVWKTTAGFPELRALSEDGTTDGTTDD